MFDPSSFANPTPLAHADTSRVVLPKGVTLLQQAGWVAWLVYRWPFAPKFAGSTPAAVDFHDAENQQWPCHMIIRHVKDP
ncbi:hypothetical protein TNCV_1763541 [Trichonephila clavipes]|nr:hypothetical protein TNCV_1763541 [Trichonephila clavipes]